MTAPITLADVLAAQARIRPFLRPTPLRRYAPLESAVGHGVELWVKHENHQPTQSFKVRNALSVMTLLAAEERRAGVVAATRGNHGQGVAYAGQLLGVPVTICVPVGNNPEKNAAMRGLGAELVEQGRDYDESVVVAEEIVRARGARMIHSTNDARVIAGAGTMTLEILEERPDLDALVIAVGGGSQAVGALVVAGALRPGLPVYGVQAARAAAIRDAWHAARSGIPDTRTHTADTFADGLATRSVYAMTFPTLVAGLADFVAVSEDALAAAVRLLLSATHNLVEGAGAAGLAGVLALRERLAGKKVGIVLSGGNIDAATLRWVVAAG